MLNHLANSANFYAYCANMQKLLNIALTDALSSVPGTHNRVFLSIFTRMLMCGQITIQDNHVFTSREQNPI